MKKIAILFAFVMALTVYPFTKSNTVKAQESEATGSKYGKDSVKCVINLSLYRESFKLWRSSKYKSKVVYDAIVPWRWVLANCPQASENIYLDGIKMFEYFIKNEKNKELKKGKVDTLLMLYDMRLENFPLHYKTKQSQEGNILGRKGLAMYGYCPNRLEEVYNHLDKSVNLDKNESPYYLLPTYFKTTVDMHEKKDADPSIIYDNYDKISEIIDANLDDPKYGEKWENVKNLIDGQMDPWFDCDKAIESYSKKYDANPTDADLLKKIGKLLDKKGCIKTDFYKKVVTSLHQIEPNAESAELLGKLSFQNEDYDGAIQYFTQAAELYEDASKKEILYFLKATALFQQKKYSEARNSVRQAIEINPNVGKYYILIADMYAMTSSSIGSGPIDSRAGYWAAYDKALKAKQVDSSFEAEANERLGRYRAYFPTKEHITFSNLKVGDTYYVGGWIGESTTIRSSD